MFCGPVRSRVDAIDGIYFCAYLFHFCYTNRESEQNYTTYIFYQSIFFKSLINEKGTSAATGVGWGGGGGAGAPVAPPFTTGLLGDDWV